MPRKPRPSDAQAQPSSAGTAKASTYQTCEPCPKPDICGFEERCDDRQRHAGRPSLYSEALVTDLIEHIATGGSQAAWCAMDGHPSERTIQLWARQRPDFCASLAHAREAWTHSLVSGAVDLVDNCLMVNEAIAKARAQADIRLRVAAMVNPARYGQKIDMTVREEPLDPDARRAEIRALTAKAMAQEPEPTRH